MISFGALTQSFYANDNSALVPQFWALEGLSILSENIVSPKLIHRDFSPIIASRGDTVNAHRPAKLKMRRKDMTDVVTIQDATLTKVPVTLDQHCHASFIIYDGEESKSAKSLITTHLKPAVLALSSGIDRIILGQYSRFLNNVAGGLGTMTTSNAVDYVIDTYEVMNTNLADREGRSLIWNTSSEALALKNAAFHSAEKVGDNGTALRTASLGQKFNFNHFMCQNMASFTTPTYTAGAINNAAGYVKGHASTITVDGFTGVVATVGKWVTIAGDDTPYRISAKAETTGNTTSITLHTALRRTVADNAVVKIFEIGAVNLVAGYAAGWTKAIALDGFTTFPKVGQYLSFGVSATSAVYTVIEVEGSTVHLDRALEAALVDDTVCHVGPPGNYNFAFCRDALGVIMRPLAPAGAGALSAVQMDMENGLALRSTITYNGDKQGHLVTLDLLLGIALFDVNLGAVLLA